MADVVSLVAGRLIAVGLAGNIVVPATRRRPAVVKSFSEVNSLRIRHHVPPSNMRRHMRHGWSPASGSALPLVAARESHSLLWAWIS
jgi:hypothetical protein